MTYTLDPPLPPTETPKDYHRIHFDTSNVADKRIVGLLACQRDPLLRNLTTKVVAIRPADMAAPPPPKGKAKQKRVNTTAPSSANASGTATPVEGSASGDAAPKGKLYEIETLDTVIFPEGGGQPFDTGKLSIFNPNGEKDASLGSFVVEGCLRKKLEFIHLVRVPEEQQGLIEGLEGKEVVLDVDWERRIDQMSLHTSQHLLSAVLDTYAEKLPTLSWSMSPYPSLDPAYIELSRSLTWKEVEEVENKCNEYIQAGKKVWVDVDMQEEGFVKMTKEGVRESRGIPTDYTDGVIRHIIIDGIDKNACCGTQLPFLTPLSFIHIIPPSTPSTSDKPTKSPTRLFFTSGPRAAKYLSLTSRNLSLASQKLAVGRADLVERVGKMDDSRKEGSSREKDLRTELARVVGESEAKASSGKPALWIKRSEKASHDFEFLGNLAQAAQAVQTAQELAAPLVIITSAPKDTTPSLLLIQSTDGDLAKSTHEALKAKFEEGQKGRYKGGGAKGRYMCKIDSAWGAAEDGFVKSVLGRP